MSQAVLVHRLRDGTVPSGSVFSDDVASHTYTGSAVLTADDQADPSLVITLTLLIGDIYGNWSVRGGPKRWKGGTGEPPSVAWTGIAWRVRLDLDLSRQVAVGATIETN